MKAVYLWLCAVLLLSACTRESASVEAPQQLSHGRFSTITVYPAHTTTPPLLLLADVATEKTAIDAVAMQARELGAALFVVDNTTLHKDLKADIANCNNLGGDFDNLLRYLEAWLQLPGFVPAVLVTTSAAAPAADAVLAAPPGDIFAGKLQVTTTAAATATTCSSTAAPTATLTLHADFPAQLALAYQRIAQDVPALPALDAKVAMLPLTELPATGAGDTFAILLSGDGGWAGFDRELAEALQAQGIGVVGWDSLRYFWQPRTPQSLAADLDTVIAHYQQQWHKAHVLLLGFSQGANVLPFTLPSLNAASLAAVKKIALISPERYAEFEFHLSNWVRSADKGMALAPLLDNYTAKTPLYCLYGSEDKNAVCPELQGNNLTVKGYDSGHHLSAEITDIVALLSMP